MHVNGPISVDDSRRVLWKVKVLLGPMRKPFVLEISHNKKKFFVVGLNLDTKSYSFIEMHLMQANKLLRECDNSYRKLIESIDLKFDKIVLKDQNQEFKSQKQNYYPQTYATTKTNKQSVKVKFPQTNSMSFRQSENIQPLSPKNKQDVDAFSQAQDKSIYKNIDDIS